MTLVFDMDGTIADLYGIPNWLSRLRNEDPAVYQEAKPLWDMEVLTSILTQLQTKGFRIAVVTWTAKDSSQSYKVATREAKREWLKKYRFPYDELHIVSYGTTKAKTLRKGGTPAILFDDNEKVRKGWKGESVNPLTEDIIEYLRKLL